jgi:1-deoxy-D-xylulose-5-phosphate reductoisomerase
METGGLAGAAFNAAKEVALDAFIADAIRFTDMAGVVEGVLDRLSGLGGLEKPAESLDMVLDMDRTARRLAREAMRLPAAAERT